MECNASPTGCKLLLQAGKEGGKADGKNFKKDEIERQGIAVSNHTLS